MGELSKDEIQKATLTTLGACFAQVLTVDEMIARIEAAASRPAAAE